MQRQLEFQKPVQLNAQTEPELDRKGNSFGLGMATALCKL